MSELFHQLHYSANANLSVGEEILLLLLAIFVWFNRKRIYPLQALYSIFLIIYIGSAEKVRFCKEVLEIVENIVV